MPHFKMDSSPGSLLSLSRALRVFGKEYPGARIRVEDFVYYGTGVAEYNLALGDPLHKITAAIGNVFGMRMLGDDRVNIIGSF